MSFLRIFVQDSDHQVTIAAHQIDRIVIIAIVCRHLAYPYRPLLATQRAVN
jgi:hypothetical protein